MNGLKQAVGRRLAILGWALPMVVITGYAGEWVWPLSLLVHFQPIYIIAGVLLALALWVLKRRRAAFAAGLGALLALIAVGTALVDTGEHPRGKGTALRVATLNVNLDNTDTGLLEAFRDVDLIVLHEADASWEPALDAFKATHPHQVRDLAGGPFSMAVLSRHPFDSAAIGRAPGEPNKTGFLDLKVGGTVLKVFAVHFPPPVSGELFELRDRSMERMAKPFRHHPPDIVLGDLNLTPWSGRLRRWTASSGLYSTYRGEWPRGTWPPGFGFFGLPLDHVLVGARIGVNGIEVRPLPGSDHDGLVADLVIPR